MKRELKMGIVDAQSASTIHIAGSYLRGANNPAFISFLPFSVSSVPSVVHDPDQT